MYPKTRWVAMLVLLVLFFLRVYLLEGWYIIAYGLGIYLLNLFIGFLSPQVSCRPRLAPAWRRFLCLCVSACPRAGAPVYVQHWLASSSD